MATALASSMASLSLCSTSRQHSCRPTPSFGFTCSMRGQGLQIAGARVQQILATLFEDHAGASQCVGLWLVILPWQVLTSNGSACCRNIEESWSSGQVIACDRGEAERQAERAAI